jgi:hypothetical protein
VCDDDDLRVMSFIGDCDVSLLATLGALIWKKKFFAQGTLTNMVGIEDFLNVL